MTPAPTGAVRGPVVRHVTPRALHAGLAVVAAVAVTIELVRAVTGGGPPVGERLVRLASYFTIWTTTLVAVVGALLAVRPARDGTVLRALRLDTLLFVVVTAVTYHLVLRDYVPPDVLGRVANLLTHTVVPVATLAVWLAVGPRPRIAWRTCLDALALPGAWLVWTFGHGAVTGWYPYPFLDAGRLGTGRALVGAAVVVVAGAALGVVLRWVDRALPPAPR